MRATLGIAASGRHNQIYVNSYLNNTGYLTAPDATAWRFSNTAVCITAKVMLRNPPNSGVNQFIACHWGTTTADQAWLLWVTSTGAVQFQTREVTTGFARSWEILTPAEYAAYGTAAPVGIGVRADMSTRFAALKSTDFITWNEVGTPKTDTAYTQTLNSTVPLGIGCRPNTGADRYGGLIYWAQITLGNNPTGAPLVRFDANDHPLNATSWTDPRGQAWNLTLGSAIYNEAASPS